MEEPLLFVVAAVIVVLIGLGTIISKSAGFSEVSSGEPILIDKIVYTCAPAKVVR